MSKEETIKNLKKLKSFHNGSYGTAIDEAIKALEQESCETIKEIPKDYKYDTETEDFLVYRHKYTGHEIHIDKPVPRYRLEQPSFEDWLNTIQELKKIMEKFDRKRLKQGKWYSNGLGTAVHCSMCKSASPYRFNYCPNCGADMENGED